MFGYSCCEHKNKLRDERAVASFTNREIAYDDRSTDKPGSYPYNRGSSFFSLKPTNLQLGLIPSLVVGSEGLAFPS